MVTSNIRRYPTDAGIVEYLHLFGFFIPFTSCCTALCATYCNPGAILTKVVIIIWFINPEEVINLQCFITSGSYIFFVSPQRKFYLFILGMMLWCDREGRKSKLVGSNETM